MVLYCFADFGERGSPLTLLSAESVFSSTVIVMKNVSTVLFLLNARSDFVCGVVVCVCACVSVGECERKRKRRILGIDNDCGRIKRAFFL